VVYKAHRDGRIFVADPALGNISFSDSHFKEIWDNNTLFIIMPEAGQETTDLLTLQDQDMRYVEDSIINQFSFVDVRYPTLMMEHNADRASTMQRVLDADPKSDTYLQPINTSLRLYYKRK